MSRSRSKKTKSSQLPLFIEKLIQMLQEQSINHIISWTTTNDSFNIKSITQFTEQILPKYFKHNNFSSFIRQLNMYGFKKIRHSDGQNVYENQFFIKGQRGLLKNIQRKVNRQKQDKLALYGNQGPGTFILAKQIQQMKSKQKDLEQICRHLLMQNQKLMDQNNTLIKKMKDQSRRKERKIQHLLLSFMASNQYNGNQLTNGQNNNNGRNMLSIMGDNTKALELLNEKHSQTPLEVLTSAISRNKNMKQFKNMLENYYNSDQNEVDYIEPLPKRKTRSSTQKSNIYDDTKLSKKQNSHHASLSGDEQSSFGVNKVHANNGIVHPNSDLNMTIGQKADTMNFQDDDGFISINDFMNLQDDADEQKVEKVDINLEESL